MKKLLALILAVALLLPAAVLADLPDISGLSYDELVQMKEKINLAMWNCQEWQEVTVPAGVWTVGEDIPVGHWTIRPLPNTYISVAYCDRLNEFGTDVGRGWLGWNGTLTGRDQNDITYGEPTEVDLNMEKGMYFINSGAVIFTPYAGKPDLGFH